MRKPIEAATLMVIGLALTGSQCQSATTPVPESQQVNVDQARRRMVETQIRARGVQNKRVLEAMSTVPRHEFVPEEYKSSAYEDSPLPTSSGQTISQPFIVALMTELIDPLPEHRVLEIGTGSGYQAAILSKLV